MVRASAASDALRQQSSPQPCCSACAVSRAPQQCAIASGPVAETTRRPAAVARAGERSSRPSGGVFGRRPTPSQRLPLLRVCCWGDVTGRAECGLQPSARALRHGHNSPTPSRSRRPLNTVAARSASAVFDMTVDRASAHLHPGRPSRRLAKARGRRRRGGCGATGGAGSGG